MGDRAFIVLHDKNGNISPTLYLHWGGSSVSELLQKACSYMAGRPGDVSYAFARLVGVCHVRTYGNLGLGAFNGPETLDKAKTKDYSHGDAGVFLVDVSSPEWKAEAHNGYGFGRDNPKTRTFAPAAE